MSGRRCAAGRTDLTTHCAGTSGGVCWTFVENGTNCPGPPVEGPHATSDVVVEPPESSQWIHMTGRGVSAAHEGQGGGHRAGGRADDGSARAVMRVVRPGRCRSISGRTTSPAGLRAAAIAAARSPTAATASTSTRWATIPTPSARRSSADSRRATRPSTSSAWTSSHGGVRRGRVDPAVPRGRGCADQGGDPAGAAGHGDLQGQALRRARELQHAAAVVPQGPGAEPADHVVRDDRHGGQDAEGGRIEIQGDAYEGYTVWFNSLIQSAGGQILASPTKVAMPEGPTKAALASSRSWRTRRRPTRRCRPSARTRTASRSRPAARRSR